MEDIKPYHEYNKQLTSKYISNTPETENIKHIL